MALQLDAALRCAELVWDLDGLQIRLGVLLGVVVVVHLVDIIVSSFGSTPLVVDVEHAVLARPEGTLVLTLVSSVLVVQEVTLESSN